ncbi:FKBP-type peptidyl-prolyl cis-trans isomerase [Desulfocapsa sulfexigens DSM 10523]|uniref:Peptidyl-prolyl cis-trans isomerase n=1 Tax=Desulfocapsa sulfexigens (strain DSM 10523 / SB164P1) TaxID=1167006 RepID=M1PK35_DESSD|nr:peptidylprolyl isomerase [Desulfocapsa sulfexigens]AGF76871.1 FKBP-type peptidyl-prolyl cis-trans isomerase [Desulfocapsa sulfexigens DSM 10523]
MTQAKKGDKVQVNYKGYLDDGTIFDSSEGKKPLDVVLGSGTVIPGFDAALVGMEVGSRKTVKIPMDDAYGKHNAELVMQVPKDQIPPDLKPEIGQKLQVGGAAGELMAVEVIDLTDDFIVLDANPPLSGKDLTFDLELVAIA